MLSTDAKTNLMKQNILAKDIEIRDMYDESLFGKVFHSYQFSQAIEQKLLADYKVVVIGVDKSSTREMIQKNSRTKITFGKYS